MNHGPIALVGSGEYLPVMAEIESELISGRGTKYIQIPTAAALEGDRSLNYWKDLGISQATRIGAQAVPLLIKNSDDANNEMLAAQIEGAGLIYFSGGNPHHLANTLRESKVLDAVLDAWKNGAALAGCSAGAMAIANHIPEIKTFGKTTSQGFALLPNVRVIPHFDRKFMAAFNRFVKEDSITVLGIDENTALVGGLNEWQVKGVGTVTVFKDGKKEIFSSGQKLFLD